MKIKNHNLEEMYNVVFDKNEEERNFLEILAKEINMHFNRIPHKEEIIVCENPENAKDELTRIFTSHKLLFVDWRYIYEGKIEKPYTMNTNLNAFAEALKKYAKALVEHEERQKPL